MSGLAVTFDRAVLAPDPGRRDLVVDMLEAGIGAVEPARAVAAAVRRVEGGIELDGTVVELPPEIAVIAIGKGAPAMARALAAIVDRPVAGLVVSDHAEPVPPGLTLLESAHPVPDARSRAAGERALAIARSVMDDGLLVVLVSGGGSSLVEAPAPGVEPSDLIATYRALLGSGAPIEAVNTVRKHLSAIKGGGLAAATRGRLVTLVLSDVVGDPLDAIASGPTVPDPTTFADALAVLEQFAVDCPPAVRTHLEEGRAGARPETPKRAHSRHALAVVGSGRVAASAAARAAAGSGRPATVHPEPIEGEARHTALECLDRAGPGATVFAGETTVTLRGGGRGGRNQEAALAAAIALEGTRDVVFAACGTDGIDGVTRAAGAIVDGETLGRAPGLSAREHLERNDSNPFLDAAGELLVSGPTGTNVGDLWVVLRRG